MHTGIVAQFSAAKGFGFISPSDGSKDVFVHFSCIEMDGYKSLKPGQKVSYEVEIGPKGKTQACEVRVLREA